MLTNNNEISSYLSDFHSGKITKGLGIGCELDTYLRWKQGNFNIILGHDNTGKTYWRTWYYLCLAVKYNFKFCIWTGENKAGQVVRDLIQWYTGKRLKDLTTQELERYKLEVLQWFDFVDNSKLYKYDELLKVFSDKDYKGCLIDPYTGLDRGYTHADNYDFLNQTRQWTNEKQVTIDVCTHPISASGRSQGMYPKGHEWEGYLRSPYKADTEGGKPFQNRCDDFIIIHRLTKHPTMKYYTLVSIDKVKDMETGGEQTEYDKPIFCEFNNGLGFKVEGINPLKEDYKEPTGNQQDFLRNKAIEKARKDVDEEELFKKDIDSDSIPF